MSTSAPRATFTSQACWPIASSSFRPISPRLRGVSASAARRPGRRPVLHAGAGPDCPVGARDRFGALADDRHPRAERLKQAQKRDSDASPADDGERLVEQGLRGGLAPGVRTGPLRKVPEAGQQQRERVLGHRLCVSALGRCPLPPVVKNASLGHCSTPAMGTAPTRSPGGPGARPEVPRPPPRRSTPAHTAPGQALPARRHPGGSRRPPRPLPRAQLRQGYSLAP